MVDTIADPNLASKRIYWVDPLLRYQDLALWRRKIRIWIFFSLCPDYNHSVLSKVVRLLSVPWGPNMPLLWSTLSLCNPSFVKKSLHNKTFLLLSDRKVFQAWANLTFCLFPAKMPFACFSHSYNFGLRKNVIINQVYSKSFRDRSEWVRSDVVMNPFMFLPTHYGPKHSFYIYLER